MFYVQAYVEGYFSVLDTSDNISELHSREDLFNIVKKYNIKINGVDSEGYVCIVEPSPKVVENFKQGYWHLALSKMPLWTKFTIYTEKKVRRGDSIFVKKYEYNITKQGVNNFCFDEGWVKSYRSGITLDSLLMWFEDNIRGTDIKRVLSDKSQGI